MAYELDYQTPGALGMEYATKWLNKGSAPSQSTSNGALSKLMAFGIVPPDAINQQTPQDNTIRPAKLPVTRNTNEIADRAFNSQIADRLKANNNNSAAPGPAIPPGGGYMMVDGRRIDLADVGGVNDPYRKSGGYVMTSAPAGTPGTGAMNLPELPPSNRDDGTFWNGSYFQQRQDMQTPMSLESRLNSIQGGGMGALVAAGIGSRISKDEWNRYNQNRELALRTEDIRNADDLRRGAFDLKRAEFPMEQEKGRAAIDLSKAQTERARWEISPQGLAAAKADKTREGSEKAQEFMTKRGDYWREQISKDTNFDANVLNPYAKTLGLESSEQLTPEQRTSATNQWVQSRVMDEVRQRASNSPQAQLAMIDNRLRIASAHLKDQAKNLQPGTNLPGQDELLREVYNLRQQRNALAQKVEQRGALQL